MELRQLEAFVAVAEDRNFTRAAARLLVAQSGLSATVRSLERELQSPLFSRTTRHVELTAAGEALLGDARRTLASARAGAEAVAAVQGVRRGTLTLGIMQASWLFQLPRLLARFRRAYPQIELSLHHAGSADLARMLEDHRVDIIFTGISDAHATGFESIPLAESRLVLACNADHPLADKAAISLRALTHTALVGYPIAWGIRILTDLAFRSTGLEPTYAFEVNDTQTLLDMVDVGLGAAVLPEALAQSARSPLHLIEIRGRRWEWTITAQTLAPAPPNPAAKAMWTMLANRHQDPHRPTD